MEAHMKEQDQPSDRSGGARRPTPSAKHKRKYSTRPCAQPVIQTRKMLNIAIEPLFVPERYSLNPPHNFLAVAFQAFANRICLFATVFYSPLSVLRFVQFKVYTLSSCSHFTGFEASIVSAVLTPQVHQ